MKAVHPLIKVAISVFAESGWSAPEKMSRRMQLSGTPSFENSILETPFRVEIRPRRVISTTAGKP
jgi:hypothetical protein